MPFRIQALPTLVVNQAAAGLIEINSKAAEGSDDGRAGAGEKEQEVRPIRAQ